MPERRTMAEKELGCSVLADYRELFGKTDIDFVVNAGFSSHNFYSTLDLLEHGFNVLCEKPIARDTAQVNELIEKQKKTGKMLAAFHQSRFAPHFEQLKKVIDSGVLGKIIQISVWHNNYLRRWDNQTLREFGGGNLNNIGSHPLDQILNLMDYNENPNVLCKMDRVNTAGDAEDYVKLILTAPGKPVVDLEVSSCDAYPLVYYKVQADSGGLTGNMKEIKWRWFLKDENPMKELKREPINDAEGNPVYCSENLKWYEDSWSLDVSLDYSYPTSKLYETVRQHLLNGKPLEITLEKVRQQIWIVEEAHRQNPVTIN
jgi:predicted dehydrogenase